MKTLFACDLDGTLIHSHKKRRDGDICVELCVKLDDEAHLGYLYQLAKEKGAPLKVYTLKNCKACGLIRRLADN